MAARGMVGVSSAEDSAAVPREGVTEAGVETAVASWATAVEMESAAAAVEVAETETDTVAVARAGVEAMATAGVEAGGMVEGVGEVAARGRPLGCVAVWMGKEAAP